MGAQRAQNFPARLVHLFRLDLVGFNSVAVQSADIPDVEFDEVKYSNGGTDVKRPGRSHTGDLVVKDALIHGKPDLPILQWFFSTYNPATGVGLPAVDLRDGSIVNLNALGQEYEQWNFTEAWIKKISGYKFDKNKSEIFMREVVISVGSCVPALLGS